MNDIILNIVSIINYYRLKNVIIIKYIIYHLDCDIIIECLARVIVDILSSVFNTIVLRVDIDNNCRKLV